MEKDLLLDSLHDIQSKLIAIQPFESESRKIKKVNQTLMIIICVLFLSVPLILFSFEPASAVIPVLLIALIALILSKSKVDKKEELREINQQININKKEIIDTSIVPRYYQNLEAVNSFISYLNEERASSFGECRRIFEFDTRESQLNMWENNLLKKEQDIIKLEKTLDIREEEINRKENEILHLHDKLTTDQKQNLDLQQQLMQQIESNKNST